MSTSTTPIDWTRPTDLISMGRVAVDFYAEQVGSPLENAQSFRKYLGGCAGNIAVGTSRLGLNSAMFSCIGKDDMGLFLKKTLEKEGVDTGLLVAKDRHLTGLVILGIDPPDRFPLIFYRENCADMQIQPEDAIPEIFRKSKALLVTGTGFSTKSMQTATLHALNLAKSVGTAVILDIDYRPVLWGLTNPGDGESRYAQSSDVTEKMQILLPFLDLIVGTEEEIRIMAGGDSLEEDIAIIRQKSPAPIVVKKGEEGCVIYPTDFEHPFEGVPFPVEVLNVLGAGDAFMSGFLRGWLRNEDWQTCARFGNANGALVVSRHGCAPAMASFDELNHFMDHFKSNPEILSSTGLAVKHQYTQLGSPQKNSLLLIAFDQFESFEKSCDQGSWDKEKISVFKQLIFKGFIQAQKQVPDAGLAILVDPHYGRDALKKSAYADYEQAVSTFSSQPKNQNSESYQTLYQTILERPSNISLKFEIVIHQERHQLQLANPVIKLKQLYQICSTLDRRLMVQLTLNDRFSQDYSLVVATLKNLYENDIYPFWWNVPGPDNKHDWEQLTDVFDTFDPQTAALIKINSTRSDQAKHQMALVKSTPYGRGLFTGENLFWDLWQQFSTNKMTDDKIITNITGQYLEIAALWQASGSR